MPKSDKKIKNEVKKTFFDELRNGGKGRPTLIINEAGKRMIVKLARCMCTEEEIASMMETTVETLHSKKNYPIFLDCLKKGTDMGRASLRRAQFKLATGGNATMLIWLGKQFLSQNDKADNVSTSDDDGVVIEIKDCTHDE